MHLGRTNRWFLGGGKALLNTYYRTAQRMGISIRYDAMVEDLVIESGRFAGVALKGEASRELLRGRAVVVATGGFEANLEWLKRHWGAAAGHYSVRGRPCKYGRLTAYPRGTSAEAN